MEVEDQNRMRDWNDYQQRIVMRHLPLSGSSPDSAVIGIGVARVLQMCEALKVPDCAAAATAEVDTGDALPPDIAALSPGPAASVATPSSLSKTRLELLATSPRGAPNVAAVSVVQAEFQGIKELDDAYVALHLSQAQRLVFGGAVPQVTAIVLQLRHTDQMAAAQERLKDLLQTRLSAEPLAVIDYETLNPFYGQTLGMFAAIFGFISVLIGAIVLFTVTNTMSMAVVERTAEIGTLRAIGLRRSGIREMFMCEGLILGCLGAVLGIVAAVAAAGFVNQLGLQWTPPSRVEAVPLSVRLAGEHGFIITHAVGLVVVGTVSALLPAARAASMNIVDALRHA
jgi:putative ABC transport system permease protein